MAMAWARLREGQKAVRLLQLMNPIEHNRKPEEVLRYRGEPYVVAADIYSAAGRVGQCGWTWYTGSASWMYRIWVEEVLGLRVRGDRLTVEPAIPDEWPGFEMTWRHGATVYEIAVTRDEQATATWLELNGQRVESGFIPLALPEHDAGAYGTSATHKVKVRLAPHISKSIAPPQERDLVAPGGLRA
jgi:cyclic beta-1,2-glucan synthetase